MNKSRGSTTFFDDILDRHIGCHQMFVPGKRKNKSAVAMELEAIKLANPRARHRLSRRISKAKK
jgi:hypothetical protein